jgi:hypothetical protein
MPKMTELGMTIDFKREQNVNAADARDTDCMGEHHLIKIVAVTESTRHDVGNRVRDVYGAEIDTTRKG